MRVAFFEDQTASQFHPLTLCRPVFELVCGQFSLRERVLRTLDVHQWGVFLRPYLAETYREEHPEALVNATDWLTDEATIFINGRWLPDTEALLHIEPNDVGVIDGTLAYLTVDPAETPLLTAWDETLEPLHQLARSRHRVEAGGKLVSRPWDLVEHNSRQLVWDFITSGYPPVTDDPGEHVALLGPLDYIYIDSTAKLDPFVVLDARKGPISIDPGVVIQSFTRIEGPCHVGHGSQLFRANVRGGTTVGPQSRVGGEVEASILHGFVNKYHDGFLGHSYVCPWVNLGAQTSNSDLKNDYSAVKVPLAGELIDSGMTKVGCFIADHSKTAINSLFNTGSSIGVMGMLLPGGELLPKHVPSFTTVWHGQLAPGLPLDRLLSAARAAMDRRNCALTAAGERLLWHVHQITRQERDDAVARFEQKRAGHPVLR
ncbi:MAG: hypothetical protein HZA46_00520 [Planctomycetales bacterium]|nr:hypothetical protein [Planctomycetales bacterium]